VGTVTELQSWVLIGVFASIMLGVLSWQTIHIGRLITVSGDRLESRIDAVDARLGSRIDAVEAKLDAQIVAVESQLRSQIQVLDKDVQAILRHVFGDGRDRL
jgi:hypothetical protein